MTGCHAVDHNEIPKHGSEQDKARAREVIGAQQSEHPMEPSLNGDQIGPAPQPSSIGTHSGNVPTPPTADQISPSSPHAVLGGTSKTQPSDGNAPRP